MAMKRLAGISVVALLVGVGLANLGRWSEREAVSRSASARKDAWPSRGSSPGETGAATPAETRTPGETSWTAPQLGQVANARRRIPAEVERQAALVIACQQMLREAPEVFVAIVAATRPTPIIALVADADDHRDALALLKQAQAPSAGLRFLELPQDTMWIRDYGPCLAQQADGTQVLLDADYSNRDRPLDDAMPLGLATHLQISSLPAPFCVDGGNLLANGQGLALATDKILESDPAEPRDEQSLAALLRDYYGVEQLVLLEPLAGEPTGHVDMFATFVAPNVVVVGEFDPAVDLENAERLNRNAARLAGLNTAAGPLRVARVPMPACDGATWRSYTNVVFANGTLLVPVYPGSDEQGRRRALATFAALLPDWRLAPIDARSIAAAGGGLHCVTMNLCGLKSIPAFPRPIRARSVRDDVLALAALRPDWRR